MSLNQKIIGVVSPIVGVCVEGTYEAGTREIYSTFNYTEQPEASADNAPRALLALVQVHLYLPVDVNSLDMRRQLRRALAKTPGFTAPTVTNAGGADGQHFVYEFDALEAW